MLLAFASFLMVFLLVGCQAIPTSKQLDSGQERSAADHQSGKTIAATAERTGHAISQEMGNVGVAQNFGAYDGVLISAVKARWYGLLDEQDVVGGLEGRIIIGFGLHSDGRISDLQIMENEMTEELARIAQKAILEQSPYKPFPSHLRDKDFRDVRFTFYHFPANRKSAR